jgi:superoxide dismutase, Fe-Mn family
MAFEVPTLSYPYDALEPHIDARTMEIHLTKHHNGYVTNLNKALEGQTALANKPIEEILRNIETVPGNIRQAVINHGGGHANHTMFWQVIGPNCGGTPKGGIADAIATTFGSFDNFRERFTAAAMNRFGSGWAWLVYDKTGKLEICSTPNQDSPYMQGVTPLVGLDVWEHAYYLKYQNRRTDYVTAWWNTVNWKKVDDNLRAAKR